MHYFSRPSREAAEGIFLAQNFGKHYEPFGYLALGRDVRLDTAGVELLEVEGKSLAIHAESASWAFLSEAESNIYRTLHGKPFGWLLDRWPYDAAAQPIDFIAHLYRRGLVALNGQSAVDHRMFADGPNYDEGHLVELLITEKCNLACPYCLAGANQSMPGMDRDIGRRTIDLAFSMNETDTLAFEFAGGEPFLKYPLMRELVEYIQQHPQRRDRRLFLSIQTNATLLDEDRVQWVKDNDIRLGISVDGGMQAQNLSRPQVNGKESFSKLMLGVELLHKFQVSFGALVVLNRANIGSAPALAGFLMDAGIHGFRLNPVAYLGDARKNWEQVGISQEQIVGFFHELMAHIVDRRLLLLEDNVRSMLDFLTSKQRRTRCMRSKCGAGDSFQAVAANGDIYPCGRATQSPGLKLGNIFDPDIASLSSPAKRHPVIAQLRSRVPSDFNECLVCPYRQLCQSGCAAQAWEKYGTVRHRTPECTFYKTMYPYLMRWLSFDEAAFAHLDSCAYFNHEGLRFEREFVGTQVSTAFAEAV